MMNISKDVVIRLALEPVDFRRSIDGLAMAVGAALGRDPMCGELFLFRNRRRTALKAIYWTPNGFIMLYKRLEKGRFTVPDPSGVASDVMLHAGLFQELLDGMTRDVNCARSAEQGA